MIMMMMTMVIMMMMTTMMMSRVFKMVKAVKVAVCGGENSDTM